MKEQVDADEVRHLRHAIFSDHLLPLLWHHIFRNALRHRTIVPEEGSHRSARGCNDAQGMAEVEGPSHCAYALEVKDKLPANEGRGCGNVREPKVQDVIDARDVWLLRCIAMDVAMPPILCKDAWHCLLQLKLVDAWQGWREEAAIDTSGDSFYPSNESLCLEYWLRSAFSEVQQW